MKRFSGFCSFRWYGPDAPLYTSLISTFTFSSVAFVILLIYFECSKSSGPHSFLATFTTESGKLLWHILVAFDISNRGRSLLETTESQLLQSMEELLQFLVDTAKYYKIVTACGRTYRGSCNDKYQMLTSLPPVRSWLCISSVS